MSANESYLQKLVLKTASLLKKAPMLTVPQAMRAANFSSTQSTDPALQMRVRRMLPSRKNVDDITPPDDVILTSPMPTNPTNSNNFTSALSLLWSWIHYFVGTIYIWGR